MLVVIWLHELLDEADRVLIGGVQTYVFELARVIREGGWEPLVVASHNGERSLEIGGVSVQALPRAAWKAGLRSRWAKALDPTALHIVANAHGSPCHLGPRSIGIQHGIYWDRPVQSGGWLGRVAPAAVNTIRCWRGVRVLDRFSRLVCVDAVYPTMAACLKSPLPWERIALIPNFAPDVAPPAQFTAEIRRIVFCRRFEKVRGARLFADMCAQAPPDWPGEIHVIGGGPEENYLRQALSGRGRVFFYRLEHRARLDAFDEKSLAVIPSLSTEGTSLACIEAWSKGALVLATSVGGLTNLIIDETNGLLVRPLLGDLAAGMKRALEGACDIRKLKESGYRTFQRSFTRSAWAFRWRAVIDGYSRCGEMRGAVPLTRTQAASDGESG